MALPNNIESQLSAYRDILTWKADEQEFASALAAIENAGVESAFGAGLFEYLARPDLESLNKRIGECDIAKMHLVVENTTHERLLAKMQQAVNLIEAQQSRVREHQSRIKSAHLAVDKYRSVLIAQKEDLIKLADYHKAREMRASEARRIKLEEEQAEQRPTDTSGTSQPKRIKLEDDEDSSSTNPEHIRILSKHIDADPLRMNWVKEWLPTWNKLKKDDWASWAAFEKVTDYIRDYRARDRHRLAMEIVYRYEFAARKEMGAFEHGKDLPTFTLEDYQAALRLQPLQPPAVTPATPAPTRPTVPTHPDARLLREGGWPCWDVCDD